MDIKEILNKYYIDQGSNEEKILIMLFDASEEGLTSVECARALGIPQLEKKYIPLLVDKGIPIYIKRDGKYNRYFLAL